MCRCPANGIEPNIQVLEGADAPPDAPSRLAVDGCSLSAAWQMAVDEETGAEGQLYGCEVTLVGDAADVSLRVAEAAPADGATVPAVSRTITVLPGTLSLMLAGCCTCL